MPRRPQRSEFHGIPYLLSAVIPALPAWPQCGRRYPREPTWLGEPPPPRTIAMVFLAQRSTLSTLLPGRGTTSSMLKLHDQIREMVLRVAQGVQQSAQDTRTRPWKELLLRRQVRV